MVYIGQEEMRGANLRKCRITKAIYRIRLWTTAPVHFDVKADAVRTLAADGAGVEFAVNIGAREVVLRCQRNWKSVSK